MSFLKPIAKSIRSRPFLVMSSALVMVAGMLFGANVAAADSVWVQSYERTSQTEACAAQVGETPWQASWGGDSSWSPSWEQWANGGKGGWVCTRSITWAHDVARVYNVGDIGPGGGLVFLISGGKTYEMALNSWSGALTPDAVASWCNVSTNVITSDGIGTGAANAVAMDAACTSGAGQSASDYSANGLSDWFLPSKDELNAMYTYQLAMPTPMVATYGFIRGRYWNSSQSSPVDAWTQVFADGSQLAIAKSIPLRVRPVRAF